ncbi:MAG: ABC transporter substrate-binding protein [Burkholderiaceae bacterium]|jgi:ABC-type branched-subunit amino acid transport system substrate-binding protein
MNSFLESGLCVLAAGLFGVVGFGPASASEIGVSDKTILLGQSAALSGPAAKLGANMNLGARIYFDAVNARGGIYGRKIELRVKDDGYESERARQNTLDLVHKDGVFALFGYVGTPTSNAAAPIYTENRVPFFGAYTGASSLREPFNRYVFNVRASYIDETERIVDQLTTTGTNRIGVFYQNDAYGKAGLEGVNRAMDRRHLKVTALATVERNSVDVSEAMKTLRAADPNAIVQISAYASCAALIQSLRAAGYTGQFVNVSFVGSQELADALGPSGSGVMITQVVPFPWSNVSPLQREYTAALKAAGITTPDFGTMEGYIAARVFVEGLRRAGRDLTREGLIAALETLRDYDLGGFTITYSPENHNGSRFVEITMIGSHGNFVK